MERHAHERGYLVVLALVFGAIFFSIITAFIGFVVTEHRLQTLKVHKERALEVAEAGLDYYKWYLSHFPEDLTNGMASSGPYIHTYEDPEDGPIGQFSLGIEGNMMCNEIQSIDITSTGTVSAAPNVKRVVYGRYARPTIAEYAYVINSNVWAGSDRVITGPYHSNGGVRMDGTNYSTVSSGLEDWLCTPAFGCTPTTTRDGVFGAGPNDEFWSFPVPPISFAGISIDLADMKAKAQATGRYHAPTNQRGYHIVLRNNGTYDLYRVNSNTLVWGYTTEGGWVHERYIISNETSLGNFTIPDGCPVIFVEDNLWLEGTVTKKVTIAAANVTTAGVDPTIVLENNIVYGAGSGTTTPGLLAIAEDSVLIPLDSPNAMTLYGIFVAQNGRFGRNHYCTDECDSQHSGNEGVSNALDPYVIQSTLTVHGTIVSNQREGTKWSSGSTQLSGYTTRVNSYDRTLVTDPPALTPHTSDTYRFIEWREVE
jgi:hypothetical protein